MADNPQSGQGRPLPKKENDLFKNVVKQYEQKQYKKAIKHADAILKKYPNHGETLAMKGLIYNNMGGEKKEESQSLVKLGLMNDMRYVLYNEENKTCGWLLFNSVLSYLYFPFLISVLQITCVLARIWVVTSIES